MKIPFENKVIEKRTWNRCENFAEILQIFINVAEYKFMNINEVIKNVVVQVLPNSRVILFGSRARGDFRENSDYDILVIVKEELSPISKMPYRTSIRKKLLSQNIFSDVLIQSESEILQKQTLTGHVVKNIMEEGMEI